MQLARSRTLVVLALGILGLLLLSIRIQAQQIADPSFNASVPNPAYSRTHPTLVIDEGHLNFHTATGRYKPFADLLKNDGYQVVPGTKKFQKETLKGVRVLVIAGAAAPDTTEEQTTGATATSGPAFTKQECDVVRGWVRGGGSLLLVADHAPDGQAAESLSNQFGVDMGKGHVVDLANLGAEREGVLIFSQDNGLLGEHPVLRGRNASEEVKRVATFTGQSLGVPAGAVALMKLSPTAYEAVSRKELQLARAEENGFQRHARAVGGRAQGVAMKFGRGRVIILGEAAMLSAQVGARSGLKMGMNVPGNDNKQFALNLLHWLSGLLE